MTERRALREDEEVQRLFLDHEEDHQDCCCCWFRDLVLRKEAEEVYWL